MQTECRPNAFRPCAMSDPAVLDTPEMRRIASLPIGAARSGT
jgi:hypothetical protein